MADRVRLVGLRQDGTTIPVTITVSPVPTASGHLVLAVVRDARQEHWQDDLTGLVRDAIAEQAHHAGDLLDQVVASLFHVGLSMETVTARRPAGDWRPALPVFGVWCRAGDFAPGFRPLM